MKFLFEGESVIESIIQRHLSYQFCFCINTVVTIVVIFFMSKCVYIFWTTLCTQRVFLFKLQFVS